MNETKRLGNLTELQCITAFVEKGYQVSIPFGEDSRYDFIADVEDRLLKIQCKSCHEVLDEEGDLVGIRFKCVRQTGNAATKWARVKYQENEIDYFATIWDNQVYVMPVNECSDKKTLRFSSKQNQPNISWAENYKFEEVVKNI